MLYHLVFLPDITSDWNDMDSQSSVWDQWSALCFYNSVHEMIWCKWADNNDLFVCLFVCFVCLRALCLQCDSVRHSLSSDLFSVILWTCWLWFPFTCMDYVSLTNHKLPSLFLNMDVNSELSPQCSCSRRSEFCMVSMLALGTTALCDPTDPLRPSLGPETTH